MPIRTGNVPETWDDETSVAEVIAYASKNLSTDLLCFAARAKVNDNVGMIEFIQRMRAVITRLDQYRRVRVKERSADASATPHKGSKTK